MYPETDLCAFPEAVCASKHSNELRWVAGMFYWIQQVQSFDQDGWNYMDKIKNLSQGGLSSSDLRSTGKTLLVSVDCILKTGSMDCNSGRDLTDRLVKVLDLLTRQDVPTPAPTVSYPPSKIPTKDPTVHPTANPTISPTISHMPSAAPNVFSWPSRQDVDLIVKEIKKSQELIVSNLLTPRVRLENNNNLYSFDGFLSALRLFADGSVEGLYFFIGHNTATNKKQERRGLANVAAFLAHSKTLAVHDGICDEQNVDGVEGKFPLSNSCGQNGVSYQNMRCALEESFMECPPDPSLQMSAVRSLASNGGGAGKKSVPPFFCGPREHFPFTGYYDAETDSVRNEEPFANRAGRTDVQACCWWGRGAAQVKGTCMYGKLNYYIGARAKEEGRRSLFPGIDFCKDPQAVCSGQYSYSLMWVTAMLSWVELVQNHPKYAELLENYDDMESEEFIDAISDIVGDSNTKLERRLNFILAVEALTIEDLWRTK